MVSENQKVQIVWTQWKWLTHLMCSVQVRTTNTSVIYFTKDTLLLPWGTLERSVKQVTSLCSPNSTWTNHRLYTRDRASMLQLCPCNHTHTLTSTVTLLPCFSFSFHSSLYCLFDVSSSRTLKRVVVASSSGSSLLFLLLLLVSRPLSRWVDRCGHRHAEVCTEHFNFREK